MSTSSLGAKFMRLIKRWTTSVAASFDSLISQVENHEALVTSAIREMQEAGAKAKVQLQRVRRDGERMQKRLGELREKSELWAERAVRVHETDKQGALECLRRRKAVHREIEYLERQVAEHVRLEKQLTADLGKIGERLDELQRKKNALSARQYRSEALQAGQVDDLGLIAEIDDIFDRWEVKVCQAESFSESSDRFEADFESTEEGKVLEQELLELVERAGAEAVAVGN